MRAEVEGRGTVYRVRVGPFETQREAQAYRARFEREERMNTLLVHRRDEA
jgi:cell division protein FtsN